MPTRRDSDPGSARLQSEEEEQVPQQGMLGMVQGEMLRLGKDVRAALAEFRTELREGLENLRRDHSQSEAIVTDLRLQLSESRAKIADLIAWRDGTNAENGAAGRIDELRRWQSWILGGMAVCGVVGAVVMILFGAWVNSQIDTRSKEHMALVQQMISEKQSKEPPAAASTNH